MTDCFVASHIVCISVDCGHDDIGVGLGPRCWCGLCRLCCDSSCLAAQSHVDHWLESVVVDV